MQFTCLQEEVSLHENDCWKALFQTFGTLSTDRGFLVPICDALLDWRRKEKETKEETDIDQAVSTSSLA